MSSISSRVAARWLQSAVTGPDRCPNCRGTGFVNLGDCPMCGGTGKIGEPEAPLNDEVLLFGLDIMRRNDREGRETRAGNYYEHEFAHELHSNTAKELVRAGHAVEEAAGRDSILRPTPSGKAFWEEKSGQAW